ncbi:peptidylprolyl isomerase [Caulobacter mirabilis]|uniref:Peptidyl-prolyl cis-trans isomerase n=1 Tax=Caulobacter mirabilis TaxID=69666 RepID=A0A2D2AVR0_9CAUL|nr:peptidylprolyl isomerase [Caulobacter mirabilis]ATQ42047.1 peptidylprolyl isomerase [Caulobacter mirabilis]
MTQHRRSVLAAIAALPLAGPALAQAPAPRVRIETPKGAVVLELYPDKAPVTAGNFLRYVDENRYEGGVFYRALRLGFAPERGLLQGGLNGIETKALPPIAHEPTSQTGLKHLDGTVSMARFDPGTAKCEFFICVGDSPYFDADPKQPGDNLGFAAFGQVIEGMDVVRALHQLPVSETAGAEFGMKGQMLEPPVPITSIKRV